MIYKNINNLLRAGLVGCAFSAVLTACTDTWDDHYDGTVAGVGEGTLWQAIQQNPELSNFASVIQATGYDRSLGSSQVFTVFAPTNDNFSQAEANSLIEEYRQQKQTMNDDDNTVIKEFVQNHIALYNYSVSPTSSDSIVLMNGKYARLKAAGIDNSAFQSSNNLFGNGVLFTVNRPVDYSANVFEYLRKDPELDSVRSFLYNPLFYYKKFDPNRSVEGGIDELGRTVYLDSVFIQRNDLFDGRGRFGGVGMINSEDSTYWMLAPTNDQWAKMVEAYTPYFNYDASVENLLTVGNRDSLAYTNVRNAILEGTVFSRTTNEKVFAGLTSATDSVFSHNAVLQYDMRSYYWGANFNYYQYYNPTKSGGIFDEPDSVSCSNGRVMKVHDWKIDPLQTFNRFIIVQAEGQASIREIAKTADSKGDSIQKANAIPRSINNEKYRSKVWNSRFVEFEPNTSNLMYEVTFNISNVLSNMPYDIYLVTTPAQANDSNSVDTLGTRLRCSLMYYELDGKQVTKRLVPDGATSAGVFDTNGKEIQYIKLADSYEFPICTYGVEEEEPQVRLFVENRTTNADARDGKYTKTTRIDCILLVPHGTLQVADDLGAYVPRYSGLPGVVMMPHGPNPMAYLMLR